MSVKLACVVLILLMSMLGVCVTPSEAVTDLIANVFGVTKTPDSDCSTPQSSCVITLSANPQDAQTYNGFTITATTNGPARIVAQDSAADWLRLENAVIQAATAGTSPCSNTASGLLNCPTISFSAVFSSPPDNTQADVSFTRQISGNIAKATSYTTASIQSAARFEGWVEGYAVDSPSHYGYWMVNCSTLSTCGRLAPNNIVDRTQTWLTGSGLPDPRDVSVQLWLFPKNGLDRFTIIYAQVTNQPGVGGGKPDCIVSPKAKAMKSPKLCKKYGTY